MIETIALVLTGLSIAASIIYYANILQNADKENNSKYEFKAQTSHTIELGQM